MEDNQIKYRWKLEDLYPNDAAWEKEKDEIKAALSSIKDYQGKLTNAEQLFECLDFNSSVSKEIQRLYSYAHMKSDEDTKISKYQAMKQEVIHVSTSYSSMAAYIEPEIIALGRKKINEHLDSTEDLKIYQPYLDNLFRQQAHTLSEKEEKIMAEAGLLADSPYSIFSVFSNAELPYPDITLESGEKVRLNSTMYSKHRASPNREERKKVFDHFWVTMKQFKSTFGEQLYAGLKVDVFRSRTRKYESSLHAALDTYNIPRDVYLKLIDNVNKNFDSFHRYLNIRKRLLKLNTLYYYDVYAPSGKNYTEKYAYDKATQLILKALAPLGEEYVHIVRKAFSERWIDVYPAPTKKSGAYSSGSAYDVHPYILLNYNEQYNDVSTLAHELGHTMHSYLSNKCQPFPSADYSIFVAEVASTFNEVLLFQKVLDETHDEKAKLSLLMNHLDGFKGTLFRQTQFAEFELKIHELVESGKPLTGDDFTTLYGEIIDKYYGTEKGIMEIDDLYKHEWTFIPHFYYNFYVYQYATSFTASIALAEKVLAKEKGALEKYLAFLSSGSSDYPVNLLKKAGVDMLTDDPFTKTMKAMNGYMDVVEDILKKHE